MTVIIKENRYPHRASKFLRDRMEIVELIGVPGGIRAFVCAVNVLVLRGFIGT
jgi:hypothetical protein